MHSEQTSSWLHRIGSFCATRPWLVLLAWVAALALALVPARTLPGLLGSGDWSVQNSHSDTTARLLRERFEDPWSRSLLLVASPSSEDPDGTGLRRALQAVRTRCLKVPGILEIAGPDTLPDPSLSIHAGKGGILLFGFRHGRSDSLVDALRTLADSVLAARAPGSRADLTGPAALSVDFSRFSDQDTSRAEGRALPLTALLLFLAFGSVWRLGIPLSVGMIASTLTLAAAWALSRLGLSLSILLQSVASMLGLALGIDYALLLVQRFQENRTAGLDARLSATRAVATSGRAVCESALAVTIGLGALLWTPLSETRSIGMAGCVVAFLAASGAITLAPALLVLIERHTAWSRRWNLRLPPARPGWDRWAALVLRRPRTSLILGLCLMAPLLLPGLSARTGFPSEAFNPPELGYQKGLGRLDSLGLGSLAYPVEIVVERTDGKHFLEDTAGIAALWEICARLRAEVPGARVLGPLGGLGAMPRTAAVATGTRMAGHALPPGLARQFLSKDGTMALVRILAPAHWGVAETRSLVRTLKAVPVHGGMRTHLGGLGAYYEDFDLAMGRLFLPLALAVIACTVLVLAFLFRSVLVPLKAVLLNLLSVGAGYGAVVWIFQQGHGAGWLGLPGATGVVPVTIPVLLFCIVFGLSMDYEVFLVSRMREGIRKGLDNAQAVREAIASTGSVVTGAAAVMVAVFGAFAFSRVYLVQMLGTGLAVAVFLDATVVRMLLVPSLMSLAGRWNWWPGKMPRSCPPREALREGQRTSAPEP